MQNKPNFRNDKMNITLDMTSSCGILPRSKGQKTKPIQTQFKPNKAKNKPNLSQNKANSKPISNDINGLDNNLPNCYISFLSFYMDKLLK